MVSFLIHLRVQCLRTDARQSPQLSRQSADDILGRIHGDAYDADAALLVGQAHAADDVGAVLVENPVERLHRIGLLHDDDDESDSRIHRYFLLLAGTLS